MKDRILNTLGAALLALCFVVALHRITFGEHCGADGKQATIRIAHWQLEGGVREAIDRMGAGYTKLHPDVRIEQIAIPDRIYPNWLITQLVGGTAPDIIETGSGTTDERLARFFQPLTELANSPNPYNDHTELAGLPLRETLFDGMEGGFSQTLLEYYAVPLSGTTLRLYFNLELLRKITGGETIPRNYADLIRLCRQTLEYSGRTGVKIIPIAGSKYNSPILMDALFTSQTQKLLDRLNPPGALDAQSYVLADRLWQGKWSLRDPEIISGLNLMKELGQYMQSGFMQLSRDDASFYFVQGHALMIATGSWDATSISSQASFPVGVGRIPIPAKDDAVYGKFTNGEASEGGMVASVAFGLTRASEHPETAKDFLLFMSGKSMAQVWTDTSGWISAIVSAVPNPRAAPFQPRVDGYPKGFGLAFSGADGIRVFENNLNHLLGANGSPGEYLSAIEREFPDALASDSRRAILTQRDNARRMDTLLGALAWRTASRPGDAAAIAKLDLLIEAITATERSLHSTRDALEKAGRSEP